MADEQTAVRGETKIDLGPHKDYVLRPGFDELCAIEQMLGEGIIPFARRFENTNIGIRELAVVIYCCGGSVKENPRLSLADVGRIVQQAGMIGVMSPVMQVLSTALKADEPPAKENTPA